jgi:hypothetical protein
MRTAGNAWRRIAASAGCAVLLAGCSAQIAGTGTLAADARPPAAGPSGAAPTGPAATPRPTALTTTQPPVPPPTTGPGSTTGSAAPSPRPGTIPAAFAGVWTGVAAQPGSTLPSWTARLVLPAGGTAGTFAVGTFCLGRVTVQAASQTRLVAREVIVSDPSDRCAEAGTITLDRTDANQVRMRWVDATRADNTASATLSRS